MAELSPAGYHLLTTCAQTMADRRDDQSLDLTPLESALRASPDRVLTHLAQEVYRLSGNGLTVRLADPALFSIKDPLITHFLAVCPVTTPAGPVTAVGTEVTLYIVGPMDPGLQRFPLSS